MTSQIINKGLYIKQIKDTWDCKLDNRNLNIKPDVQGELGCLIREPI